MGLTRGLARDLGPDGIRANAIAPGRVVPERAAGQVTDAWKAESRQLQRIPDQIGPSSPMVRCGWQQAGRGWSPGRPSP